MFLHKTPSFLFKLYPSLIWRKPTKEKVIYLTFDDGPIPNLTPWVLDVLREFNAKATFFCVGENVQKHPEIFQQIIEEGHAVGNHTFNHLNGWKTPDIDYLRNTLRADEEIRKYTKTDLFRPPYGRIGRQQMKQLGHKRMIMWDVLSGDFSAKLNPERVLSKSIRYTSSGSIVVFHDNLKATQNLKYALPAYLAHFIELGYSFKAL
ncbi:MAG: polysaccharide deacetylase family protein [Roseivirga sp.]|nr:polysaccharide deacetylase family protein [Roseivirga sp.]